MKNVYSENVLTSWLCHSIDTSCLCMYLEDPLVTSYEAVITVTTSDGFGSDLYPLSLHVEHSIIMNHLWPSQVEIKHYFITHFTTLNVLWCIVLFHMAWECDCVVQNFR